MSEGAGVCVSVLAGPEETSVLGVSEGRDHSVDTGSLVGTVLEAADSEAAEVAASVVGSVDETSSTVVVVGSERGGGERLLVLVPSCDPELEDGSAGTSGNEESCTNLAGYATAAVANVTIKKR